MTWRRESEEDEPTKSREDNAGHRDMSDRVQSHRPKPKSPGSQARQPRKTARELAKQRTASGKRPQARRVVRPKPNLQTRRDGATPQGTRRKRRATGRSQNLRAHKQRQPRKTAQSLQKKKGKWGRGHKRWTSHWPKPKSPDSAGRGNSPQNPRKKRRATGRSQNLRARETSCKRPRETKLLEDGQEKPKTRLPQAGSKI